MSSARRPDSDDECDYPHPPPRVFLEAPPTIGQTMGGAIAPGLLFGAIMGGGCGLTFGGLVMEVSSNNSLIENVIIIILSALGGALAGGFTLGALYAGVLSFLIGIEWLFDLVTRPFRRTVDPDADLADPW